MYLSFANIKILWGYTFGRNMPTDLPFYDAMATLVRFHGYGDVDIYARAVQVQL